MIDRKSIMAVIPARGGSKGLPGKNIRPLCGKPLIAWSIENAQRSRYLDEVLVSTDDPKIADVARRYGAAVPFLRPEELASDAAKTFDAVRHALDFYREKLDRQFDLVVLLEPTSPLREDDDVDLMLEKLLRHWEQFDSIVSVGVVHEHPAIMKRLSGDQIEPFHLATGEATRRQDLAPAYFPYGVAYIVKTSNLMAEQTFYTQRCTYHVIQRHQTYEIDDLYDFICVEAVMQHRRAES
jgi:CMP-N-acetylneuraminic acid synthetase